MDSILGYHLNPLTCGIAKFNKALAQRMDIPVVNLFSPEVADYRAPLLSMKLSEFAEPDRERLAEFVEALKPQQSLRLFLHAYSGTEVESRLLARADAVYCGNEELAQELAPLHKNVIEAWCPGALFDAEPFPETEISIYSFGMAHKVRADYYHRLKDLLEATGKSYSLYISTALHEGTSFDDSFTEAFEEMRTIFGNRIYFLGFISDTAVFNMLRKSTYFAAFFGTGVRANNTSVNTAMQCGAVVLTNLDEHSPHAYLHLESVVDIRQCEDGLPSDPALLAKIGERGRVVAQEIGWDPLLELIATEESRIPDNVHKISR
jgi:hypothetical protein